MRVAEQETRALAVHLYAERLGKIVCARSFLPNDGSSSPGRPEESVRVPAELFLGYRDLPGTREVWLSALYMVSGRTSGAYLGAREMANRVQDYLRNTYGVLFNDRHRFSFHSQFDEMRRCGSFPT